MQTTRPRHRHLMWSLITFVYLVVLAMIVLQAYLGRIPATIAMIPHYDTIGHTLLLGGAAYLLHRTLNRRKVGFGACRIPAGPLIILLIAALEEAFQILSPLRTASFTDLAADVTGVAMACALDWALCSSRPRAVRDRSQS